MILRYNERGKNYNFSNSFMPFFKSSLGTYPEDLILFITPKRTKCVKFRKIH